MPQIQVIRENIDQLTKDEWWFYVNDKIIAVVDSYTHLTRESKKHGWKTKAQFERIFSRSNTIKIEDVPFDADIIAEVKRKIIDSIQIKKS
jgi:hypothetical protein